MANESTNPNETSETTEQTNDTASLEARIKQLESENGKLRQANTTASAEASKRKHENEELQKQLNAKMSDEERKQKEQDAAYAAMQEKLAALEAERDVANFTAVLSASDIGMDAETAKSVAEALHSGETDKVFDGIRRFIASHDKALAEKAMLENPTLPGGGSTQTITKAQFDAMDYTERVEFYNTHPDLYAEYTRKT